METINKTVWVLLNTNGEFFTGYEFSPNFTEALLYADPTEVQHDRDMYGVTNCTVQAVLCVGQEVAR